jgi:hypothetical protein
MNAIRWGTFKITKQISKRASKKIVRLDWYFEIVTVVEMCGQSNCQQTGNLLQNENSPILGLCQLLPPAALTFAALCHNRP